MRAFALLEFLVFIAVLSVVIVAMLKSYALKHPETLAETLRTSLQNITICNTIAPHCVFDSMIPQSAPFFNLDSAKAP